MTGRREEEGARRASSSRASSGASSSRASSPRVATPRASSPRAASPRASSASRASSSTRGGSGTSGASSSRPASATPRPTSSTVRPSSSSRGASGQPRARSAAAPAATGARTPARTPARPNRQPAPTRTARPAARRTTTTRTRRGLLAASGLPVLRGRGGGVAGRGPGGPGDGAPTPETPARRQRWLIALTALVLVLFVGRLVQVQLVDGPATAAATREGRLQTTVTQAHRGDITDADGVVLATSVDRYTITADPQAIQEFRGAARDVEDGALGVAELLAPVLDRPKAELAAQLSGDGRYVVLAKNVVPEVQRAVAELRLGAYISATLTAERTYPAGTVAGNLIGFVDADQAGQGGIEAAYDDLLTGTAGKDVFERGRGGQRIPTGEQESTPAEPGEDVRLTLVQDVQWKAEDAINAAVSASGAAYGIVVVEDVRTGELVALADSGSVDPNDRSTSAVADGSRAVKDIFEPGSTGKVVTMAAALEGGYWTADSQFTVPDTFVTPNGQTIRDSHEHAVQRLTLTGVLAESSNTGTVQVGEPIPLQVRYDYLRKFGFGQPTGLGLPGESAGIVHAPDQWDGRTRYTVLFGQGLAVNALQATSVFATVANGGVRMTPTLLAGTTDADGTFTPAERDGGTRVVSEETADTVVHMMEAVVDDGTGSTAQIPGYRVAGKTGTAQIFENGGTTYMASFVGVAPADDPRYAVGVFLKSPQSSIYGGVVAAPVFKDVMGFTLQQTGVGPSTEPYTPLPTTW